jgi:hypothetical protein
MRTSRPTSEIAPRAVDAWRTVSRVLHGVSFGVCLLVFVASNTFQECCAMIWIPVWNPIVPQLAENSKTNRWFFKELAKMYWSFR